MPILGLPSVMQGKKKKEKKKRSCQTWNPKVVRRWEPISHHRQVIVTTHYRQHKLTLWTSNWPQLYISIHTTEIYFMMWLVKTVPRKVTSRAQSGFDRVSGQGSGQEIVPAHCSAILHVRVLCNNADILEKVWINLHLYKTTIIITTSTAPVYS